MLFSVVIPTYNYGHFLPYSLDSVLAQTGYDYEIIVVDDGSTDNTSEVVKTYCARHGRMIRYTFQSNQGPSAARNQGAAHANGYYLLFLDADDRLLPEALSKFRMLHEQSGGTDFAFGGHISVGINGVMKSHPAKRLSHCQRDNFVRYLRRQLGDICHGSSIIRREVFKRLKYPEAIHHNEDVVLFAKLLATTRCHSFPDPVVAVHKHPDSLRHNVQGVLHAGLRAVDNLFDVEVLPQRLMTFKAEFLSRHYLMQFRALYLAGEYAEARKRYRLAIRSFPKNLLKLSSLSKYLRSVFKT